jgi:tetratricopeptide (TPR) repeat protein
MARAEKLTRKQLLKEPDEFITTSARALGWAAAHRRQLNIAICVALALTLVVTAVRWYMLRAEQRAERAFENALVRYERLQASSGAETAYRELSPEFETLVSGSGSGRASRAARLMLADIALRAGDTARAISQYEALLPLWGDSTYYTSLIRRCLAGAYRQQGDTAAAVGQFEAVTALADAPGKDEALFHLGILYGQLNQPDKSSAAYRRLLAEHPDSIYAAPARDKTAG